MNNIHIPTKGPPVSIDRPHARGMPQKHGPGELSIGLIICSVTDNNGLSRQNTASIRVQPGAGMPGFGGRDPSCPLTGSIPRYTTLSSLGPPGRKRPGLNGSFICIPPGEVTRYGKSSPGNRTESRTRDGTMIGIRDGTKVRIRDDTALHIRDGTLVHIRDDTTLLIRDGTIIYIRNGTDLGSRKTAECRPVQPPERERYARKKGKR